MKRKGKKARAGQFAGAVSFLDVRTSAMVLAFVAVMWLVSGLAASEVPARVIAAKQCIHILLWQALAFYMLGLVGEWLPRAALFGFCAVIVSGLVISLAMQGPWFYGPDLLMVFNGAMAWVVWLATRRYLRTGSATKAS
ncbi:hypothetical protein L1F30_12545 [Simiduia sp. 21SJ11W-1]|uniref:hypothetical protein n=1 Tax=Simiduia sp. 21SJ11W-1 TaxID=2909669 RepID=UPI00209F4F9A|nr:hypothetical protein [Simiduia sp. 21SJ11W-1]UTA46991.1 hypothetical protein L1F30_12545 [Simiduia sp. 21SJ11W-1]